MSDRIEIEISVVGVPIGEPQTYSLDEAGQPLSELLTSIPGLDLGGGQYDLLVRNQDREVLITPQQRRDLTLAEALRRSTSGDLEGQRFRLDATAEHVGAARVR